MKNTKGILCFLLVMISFLGSAQDSNHNHNHQETYKVSGLCEMCKTRIETAAKKSGASKASWSAETQILSVEYNGAKTSQDLILKKIAEVGHDNEKYKAPDEVYKNLPGCCLYERALQESPKQPTESVIKQEQLSVKGLCEMCKVRIEKTATENGATKSSWNVETQILNVEYDTSQTSSDQILKKIAEVGHDNEKYKAPDEVYKNLPGCCLYDRTTDFPSYKVAVENPSEENTQTQTEDPEITENPESNIEGITLVKNKAATSLNKKEVGLTFNINSKELLKAACCNLSESFETNATVDVSYSNAVTGTKQLKMLGLDQKYTALTKELLPEIRGLASAYGLTFIPGKWISGIQLTKGGSSVVNGYESITGQINTELVKFHGEKVNSINLFSDFNGRVESNIVHSDSLNEHWNQSVLLHGNATMGKMDDNNDGFLDRPRGKQLNATYLLNYNDLDHSGWATHFGINFLVDRRISGQTNFDEKKDRILQPYYGVDVDIQRFQIWNKTGFVFKDKPYQSFGFMNQFTNHQQDSFFGLRNYFGKQQTYYSNLIFESIIGNTNHKYKTGASFLYDRYNEDYLLTNYKRTETVPGVFFEYTLTGGKYVLVAGARTDFHNLAGTQFTPRLNFKYDITPQTILRLSAGRGFRTANIFAENQHYLGSNREIEIHQNGGDIYGLKPEIAWNYGASLQQEFKLFNRKSSLLVDFFRTDFTDQVLVDLDNSPQKLVFYNLDGKSFANSFQTQFDITPLKNLELRAAYKYYDVQADYADGKKEIPFMSKHRGFFNAAYTTNKSEKNNFWTFDATLQLVGKQRLPNMASNPSDFQLPEYSSSFSTLNAQIAFNLDKAFRFYVGGENITNYKQKNAIIDAKNPFGNYFDGGMVYAPVMGANYYVGVDINF